tara:strand:+ start:2654 stop:2962 length:309 start_codon:yes stop_codon:yes gene_type:complete
MKKEIINKLRKKALESQSKFKIAAIGISSKGNVVGCKNNSPRFGRQGGGFHAEEALIRSTGGRIHTIILCRVGRSGIIRPIEPCKKCQKMIEKYGIKVEIID